MLNYSDKLDKEDYSFMNFTGKNIENRVFSTTEYEKGITNLNFTLSTIKNVLMDDLGIASCTLKFCRVQNSKFNKLYLKKVRFESVEFRNVDFTGCRFYDCIFESCSFYACNFNEAIISDKLFKSCSFDYNTLFIRQVCPENGSYIGYKKAYTFAVDKKKDPITDILYPVSVDYLPVIVKLRITDDSKRSSATSKKCRASKCEVVSITNIHETVSYNLAFSSHDPSFVYEVGKVIEVEDFDEDRWNECSTGIHHFLNREDAVDY